MGRALCAAVHGKANLSVTAQSFDLAAGTCALAFDEPMEANILNNHVQEFPCDERMRTDVSL